ncbi:MAG TPA: hypothetical protein VMW35_00370 [Myxococcota bacterium]|jgi:hypothetical protein|nr:hypothetical protein [Myxococcota bacterium]
MHRSEVRESVCCAACGASIFIGEAREYAYGADSALCFDCAKRRGGTWDEHLGRWAVPPEVSDLRDEED